MNFSDPGHRITLLVWSLAVILFAGLIIAVFNYQVGLNKSGDKSSGYQAGSTPWLTSQPTLTPASCSAKVLAPEYSPKDFYPPSMVKYGSRLFLVSWTVTNTSEDCVWSSLQLQTTVEGQLKTLNMMPPDHSQPASDKEFVIWDINNSSVNRVNPGQRVTISVQINGLDLARSNGKIDRSFVMIVNGQKIAGGRLIAQLDQWVVVILPTATPTFRLTPTRFPATVTPSRTPTLAIPPFDTPVLPNP